MSPDADFAEGGIKENVGKSGVGQGAFTKACDLCVSSCAQIRETFVFEIPDSTPNAATRSSTLRVETPWT